MDEIKHTTEASEAPAQAACPAVATPAASNDTPANEAEAPQATAPAEPQSKADVIDRLKEIVYQGATAVERQELDRLKMLYYRFHTAEVVAEREKYIAEGGEPEAFVPQPDGDEENFKAQLALIRELRSKAAEAAEREKLANLEQKQQIIDSLKELAATPEAADKGYEQAKQLQAKWKEVGPVPPENATELWKNYQLYVEQFYDQLRLNHEMRAYDFKKNLEIKTRLCEAAEKLASVEDPISAFHQLQKLHAEFRETGPVAKELREEIWKRFKDASTAVNKRHQEHFEQIKAREAQNLEQKTQLCQQVEALDLDSLQTYAQWEETTKRVLEFQAQWKQIGFTPRKVNAEIFERFRSACDRFFQAKTAYFKQSRERLSANLAAKNALIAQAEALRDSTDWNATGQKLVELQKEWKKIGPVAHKQSDIVWKRFNDACNHFFHQRNEAHAGQRRTEEANLQQKLELIEQLRGLAENPAEDAKAQLAAVRELQARWNEIGHVPFSKKEKTYRAYRELCDKIYDKLHENAGRRRIDDYRRSVAEKPTNELQRERQRLQGALEAKKQEIKNYETNLGFFRTSTSKGNALVADLEKKIQRLKDDLAEIGQKLELLK